MNERYKDTDLREALRRKYADVPELPADFMASMMGEKTLPQPLPEREGSGRPVVRRLWPWVAAAASLLLLIGIGLTMLPREEEQVPVVAKKVEQRQHEEPKVEPETQTAPSVVETPQPQKQRKQQRKAVVVEQLLAQESAPVEEAATEHATETANDVAMMPQTKPKTLTDSDIPITRPENYKYTPEEIALMKKQAAEAYLKWVELELEIAKYNLEQTAQK